MTCSTAVQTPITWQSLYEQGPGTTAWQQQNYAEEEPTFAALGITGGSEDVSASGNSSSYRDIDNGTANLTKVPANQTSSIATTTPGNYYSPGNNSPSSIVPTAVDDSGAHTLAAGNLQTASLQTFENTYLPIAQRACDYYNNKYGTHIDPNQVLGMIWQESKGDPNANSGDGNQSRGLMQVSNSSAIPTAAILAAVKNPDGSIDTHIPNGGGNQYDIDTSIFSGVKYLALEMSHQMGNALQSVGLPPSELGDFSNLPSNMTTAQAAAAYNQGPGQWNNAAGQKYANQTETWASDFANGRLPTGS